MAIIQTLLAFLSRQASKLLNMVFGWATTTLFGKVPQNRQIWLSALALASVTWLVVVLGVLFPALGVFLLSFVTLPEWVNDNLVRLAMLAAVLILPLLIGAISLKMLDPEDRPQGAGATANAVLRGYPTTLAIAIALVMMIIFVPVMRLRTMLKRWASEHVPVIAEEQDYLEIVQDIERALDQSGYEVEATQASFMLRWPLKVMMVLSGRSALNQVADNLKTLVSPKLELILHPSDLVISGPQKDVARARAIITEQLAFSKAYLTWSKEANEMEDRLGAVWEKSRAQVRGHVPAHLSEELYTIEHDLRTGSFVHDEWEVLFREKLLVERGLLQVAAGMNHRPQEPSEQDISSTGAQKLVENSTGQPQPLATILRLSGALALTAAALAAIERRLARS